jgi:hypothetical protein
MQIFQYYENNLVLIFHIEKKDFEDVSVVVHIAYLLSQMNSRILGNLKVVTPMAQVGNCPEIYLSILATCTFAAHYSFCMGSGVITQRMKQNSLVGIYFVKLKTRISYYRDVQ